MKPPPNSSDRSGYPRVVHHRPWRHAVGRNIPQFFDPNGVRLRKTPIGKRQLLNKRLREIPSNAVGKDRDLRPDINTGFKGRLAVAVAVDASVTRPYADDPVTVVEHL